MTDSPLTPAERATVASADNHKNCEQCLPRELTAIIARLLALYCAECGCHADAHIIESDLSVLCAKCERPQARHGFKAREQA